jgi:hypothetical protein
MKNRVSNNVGGVKHFCAHYRIHSEKSAISLPLKMWRSKLSECLQVLENMVELVGIEPTTSSLRTMRSPS